MPAFETMDLKQKAQYWAFAGNDGQGDPRVSPPVELSVRWSFGETLSVDADGNAIALDATVVVNREVLVDSIMWQGTAAEHAAATAPTYYQVKRYSETPDIKGRNIRREVQLSRYGNSLPEVTS